MSNEEQGLKLMSIWQRQWPLMESQRCREHVTPGLDLMNVHEPLELKNGKWLLSDENEGHRMEVRVCKHCGVLYYECWEVKPECAKKPDS